MATHYPTLMHRWFDQVWNQRQTHVIDELLTQKSIGHGLSKADGSAVKGPEDFKRFHHEFSGAFPDLHIEVLHSVTEGDLIVLHCRATGTHAGAGLGLTPTGKRVTFTGTSIARTADGKLVEWWDHWDFLGLFTQLEAVEYKAAARVTPN